MDRLRQWKCINQWSDESNLYCYGKCKLLSHCYGKRLFRYFGLFLDFESRFTWKWFWNWFESLSKFNAEESKNRFGCKLFANQCESFWCEKKTGEPKILYRCSGFRLRNRRCEWCLFRGTGNRKRLESRNWDFEKVKTLLSLLFIVWLNESIIELFYQTNSLKMSSTASWYASIDLAFLIFLNTLCELEKLAEKYSQNEVIFLSTWLFPESAPAYSSNNSYWNLRKSSHRLSG